MLPIMVDSRADQPPAPLTDPDTIVAISTPPGRGGLGVVRLSGPAALSIAAQLLWLTTPLDHARARFARILDPEHDRQHGPPQNEPPQNEPHQPAPQQADPSETALRQPDFRQAAPSPRQPQTSDLEAAGSRQAETHPQGPQQTRLQPQRQATHLLPVGLPRDPGPAPHQPAADVGLGPPSAPVTIDDAVVTAFHAPHSYTGEDLVEISAHGSPVVLSAIVAAALTHGARLAAPGEFTQRAFLAGRLDLTQAEAVHDLIAAQTLDQARVAAQQLGGALSRRVAPAKESLLRIITLLEAGMDFASGELDDVDVVPPGDIAASIAATRAPLAALADSFQRGQILRNGAALAIVGPANAGKSSLFNRLLERDRAIVTPIPGTTRDTIEESLSLGGIPLRLIDTAGLRDLDAAPAPDLAEQQGIARSREALADADLVLLVHDATQPLSAGERSLAASLVGRPHLLISNKVDLLPAGIAAPGQGDLLPQAGLRAANEGARPHPDSSPVLATSALTGAGLDTLRAAILSELQAEGAAAATGALNNLRQQQAVTASLRALDAAANASSVGLPHELLLLDLHAALIALDSLTGATTPDDILARIFSTFCIGK